jgi:glyoxylase-like metal-dependent hydrolase (beta-lactamase superfamily II)
MDPPVADDVLPNKIVSVILIQLDDADHLDSPTAQPHNRRSFGMTSESGLSIDVHVAPMRPFVGAASRGAGDQPLWSPMSSSLIAGEEEAVLVDTLITFDQVDVLADWAESHGKPITAILITHGHSDHWIGLARLLEHFPGARGLATGKVLDRARFEATDEALRKYWHTCFPGEIPDSPVLPGLLEEGKLELDGHELQIIDVGQGDTEHSSIVYAPSIGAVVAGDVVYNQVHMMTAETNAASREAWVRSLDVIAALNPTTVVSGHKRVGAPDSPETIEQSRQYLRDFSRIVDEQETVEGIVAAMLELHGDRDNPRVLWYGARQAVAKRSETQRREAR